jgi:hypothetical protein
MGHHRRGERTKAPWPDSIQIAMSDSIHTTIWPLDERLNGRASAPARHERYAGTPIRARAGLSDCRQRARPPGRSDMASAIAVDAESEDEENLSRRCTKSANQFIRPTPILHNHPIVGLVSW